jgi:hypothetical protein
MMEHKRNHPTWNVIGESAEDEIKKAAADRLQKEQEASVLHEAIWIQDSMFFPSFQIQPQLEDVVRNGKFEAALRFRAMTAVSRMILVKAAVGAEDIDLSIQFSLRRRRDDAVQFATNGPAAPFGPFDSKQRGFFRDDGSRFLRACTG